MKIIDQLKQDVETQMKCQDCRLAKKYIRITPTVKEKLVKMVLQDKKTIKGAAALIGINYSSAKGIWAEYKKTQMVQSPTKENSNMSQKMEECKSVHSETEYVQKYCAVKPFYRVYNTNFHLITSVGGENVQTHDSSPSLSQVLQ